MPDYSLEKEYADKGYKVICGVDEAGRGPLCGPVFAAACVLPEGLYIEGLNDSKKLTERKREKLFDVIKENAVAYCISSASVEEIDEMNILEADLLAMRRAIDGLSVRADFALIDGNINRGFDIDTAAIVKGDSKSMSISAASILAKVARDRLCLELDAEYPQYKIAKHKGYGTKEHIAALFEYGPSPIHRKQFIRFLDKKDDKH